MLAIVMTKPDSGYGPGQVLELPERAARRLIAKGVAREFSPPAPSAPPKPVGFQDRLMRPQRQAAALHPAAYHPPAAAVESPVEPVETPAAPSTETPQTPPPAAASE